MKKYKILFLLLLVVSSGLFAQDKKAKANDKKIDDLIFMYVDENTTKWFLKENR